MKPLEKEIMKRLHGYTEIKTITPEEIICTDTDYLPKGVKEVFCEKSSLATAKRIFLLGKDNKKLTIISIKTSPDGVFKDIPYLDGEKISLRDEITYIINY